MCTAITVLNKYGNSESKRWLTALNNLNWLLLTAPEVTTLSTATAWDIMHDTRSTQTIPNCDCIDIAYSLNTVESINKTYPKNAALIKP